MTTLNKSALAPATQTAAQPAQAQQAEPAPAPKLAQTGLAKQDGFEATAAQPLAAPQKAVAAAPATEPFQPLGAAYQPAILQATAPATTPAPVPIKLGGFGTLQPLMADPVFAGKVKSNTLLQDKVLVGKALTLGEKSLAPNWTNQPDPKSPTKGMTEEERKAYDALTPDQKAQYDKLHEQACSKWQVRSMPPEMYITTPDSAVDELQKLLTSGQFPDYLKVNQALAGDPRAQKDLRDSLFQGKLLEPSSDTGQNALSYLVELSKGGTTSQGVDRTRLLSQLVHDIAHPEQMAQGSYNHDCAGTAAAFVMALSNPAEYARVITGLAEDGEVDLSQDWKDALGTDVMKLTSKFNPNDPRSPTQQLFAKTFVSDAAGPSKGDQLRAMLLGITGDQFAHELNDKFVGGGHWNSLFMPPADAKNVTPEQRAQAQQVAQQMLESASWEHPVFANVNGHWVTVVGVQNGEVYFQDSQGKVDHMPMSEVMGGLNSIVYQRDQGPRVPRFMHNKAWGKPGGGGNPRGGVDGIGN